MENEEKKQEQEERRISRKKLVVTIIGTGLVLAAGAGGVYYYMQNQSTQESEQTMQQPDGGFSMDGNVVTASGTTSIGIDAVTFEIDFLEDTSLYVEEVYLSSGDTVEAGAKYLKFTDESIAEARSELETTAEEAQLSYRSGVITNKESQIEAKYTYQQTLLEASQAQAVYDETLASLQETLDAAEEAYNEAKEDYEEFYNSVTNGTLYDEYEIDEKKAAYEDAKELYNYCVEQWEVTDDELSSSSSGSSTMTMTATTTISTESTAMAESTDIAAMSETEEDTTTTETTTEGTDSGMSMGGMMGGGGSVDTSAQEEKAYRQSVIKTVQLLKEEMEDLESEYEKAEEEYQDAVDNAELKLQTLLNTYESKREDYEDAQIAYQKNTLSAKTTYETAVAKGETAQMDYETTLTSLQETLDKLADAKEEAEDNLALFESLVGDGYFYTKEAGTLVMSRAEEGAALAGDDIVFAYSNPDKITVSVSVSQDSIAQLSVGESATVIISDYGTFSGTIETINPVSSSDSRTSVTYTVEVTLEGDVSALDSNLTATVIFGDVSTQQGMGGQPSAGGQPETSDQLSTGEQSDMGEQPSAGEQPDMKEQPSTEVQANE